MSIEKIKERIKMIEENNFELNEVLGTTYIDPKDIPPMGTGTTSTGKIFGKNIQQPTGHVFQKDLAVGGYAMGAANKARQTVKQAFNGSTNLYVGDSVNIPSKHLPIILEIYKVMKKYNALAATEIDLSTFSPKYGYTQRDDVAYLKKSNSVAIIFDDDKFTNLVGMHMDFKIHKISDVNFNNLFNDLDSNKNPLHISSVTRDLSNKTIDINF